MAAVLLLALAVCTLPVEAGCKKRKANVPPSERYFNHQPLEQLPLSSLPKSFSWQNKDGRSWLAPSWNQHIPQYCECWPCSTG